VLSQRGQNTFAQSDQPGPSILRLPVDEVVLTFNATDAHGLPIDDLKASEIRLRDNGLAPRRIIAFEKLVNRPIRAGILLDTSESMANSLPADRAIAGQFLQHLFRQKSDRAFVSQFSYGSEFVQQWTSDSTSLMEAINRARQRKDALGGTALFDAVFRACFYSFDKVDPTATGNFILLFSDGEDNAGLTSLDEAARACQRSNTQVFAFLPAAAEEHASTGPKALRDLAAETGGQVYLSDDSDETIWKDLQEIESKIRNQYRLVYKPSEFKHDGAFHEIELQPSDRVSRIEVRSGYFAPGR
jgi:Ca-activated chloride channel family protein